MATKTKTAPKKATKKTTQKTKAMTHKSHFQPFLLPRDMFSSANWQVSVSLLTLLAIGIQLYLFKEIVELQSLISTAL